MVLKQGFDVQMYDVVSTLSSKIHDESSNHGYDMRTLSEIFANESWTVQGTFQSPGEGLLCESQRSHLPPAVPRKIPAPEKLDLTILDKILQLLQVAKHL